MCHLTLLITPYLTHYLFLAFLVRQTLVFTLQPLLLHSLGYIFKILLLYLLGWYRGSKYVTPKYATLASESL